MTPLREFTNKWCNPQHPPTAVSESDIASVERTLSIKFPQDYRQQIIDVGCPFPTLSLLTALEGREGAILDDDEVEDEVLPDLSELTHPSTLIEDTESAHDIGLPTSLIAIGSDSMGNLFCFNPSDPKGTAAGQAPIYFWDQDFDEVIKIADSFSDWINMYLGDWAEGLTYADF